MIRKASFLQGWRSLWEPGPRHEVATVTRLLGASVVAVALALGLMTIVAVFGRIDRPGWWWTSLLPNIGICLCIVWTLFGVLRPAERCLPESLPQRMSQVRILDDGVGLAAPRKRLRPGSGLALANLRTRLLAQFGTQASLVLRESGEGTEAVLSLPYRCSISGPLQQVTA